MENTDTQQPAEPMVELKVVPPPEMPVFAAEVPAVPPLPLKARGHARMIDRVLRGPDGEVEVLFYDGTGIGMSREWDERENPKAPGWVVWFGEAGPRYWSADQYRLAFSPPPTNPVPAPEPGDLPELEELAPREDPVVVLLGKVRDQLADLRNDNIEIKRRVDGLQRALHGRRK